MKREQKMFNVAFDFLERHYNDKDLELVGQELPTICSKFSSRLYQNLIIAVVEHLEAKLKYEQERREIRAVRKNIIEE